MCVHIFPPLFFFFLPNFKSCPYITKVMNIDFFFLFFHINLSEVHSGNPYFLVCGLGWYSLHSLSILSENNFLLSLSEALISSMQQRLKTPPLSPVCVYAAVLQVPFTWQGSPASSLVHPHCLIGLSSERKKKRISKE